MDTKKVNSPKFKDIFFIKRFLFLIYYEFRIHFNFVLISLIGFSLFYTAGSLLFSFIEKNFFTAFAVPSVISITNLLGISFFVFNICYFFFATKSLNIFHFKEKGIWYYLLPCSMVEKFTSKLVFFLIAYPALFLFLFFLSSLLIDFFRSVFFSQRADALELFTYRLSNFSDLLFFPLWSLFFFNSSIFKKNVFIKSILAILILGIITIITYFAILIFMKIKSFYVYNITSNNFVDSYLRKIISTSFGLILILFAYLRIRKMTPK